MDADKAQVQLVKKFLEAAKIDYKPYHNENSEVYGFSLSHYGVTVFVGELSNSVGMQDEQVILLRGKKAVCLFCALFAVNGFA